MYANSANDRPSPKKHGVRFFLAINEDKQCLALAWKDRIGRRVNRGICLGTWAVGTFVATAVAACERMMLPSIRGFSSTSVHCCFSSGLWVKFGGQNRTPAQHRGTRTRFHLPIPGGSLDQSSQHRYDPLVVRFTAKTESIVNRIAYPQNIMNRCKFNGRPSSNFKESILVLEALFTIAFRNVQWN